MPNNNRQIISELGSLFNEDYVSKIYHLNEEPNLETRIEIYRPISFKEFRAQSLTGKKVADFSVHSKHISERDYVNKVNISWLDRDFSKEYAPQVMNFLIDNKVNIINISTLCNE